MAKSSRPMKVYRDEAKDRHTSHWDLDYMSSEQIEALYRGEEQWPQNEVQRPSPDPGPPPGPEDYRRLMKVVAGLLALVLVLIGLLLLLR